MSSPYEQLLEATIQHLEFLQRRGTRFVSITPGSLAQLKPAPSIGAAMRSSLSPIAKAPAAAPPAVPTPPAAISIAPAELIQPASSSDAPPLDPAAREAAMTDLRARAAVCMKCPNLASSRKNVVFGVGDIHSPLMFVGEAPGADEDAQGEPFVGSAGQLLTKIIQTMGFNRNQVYIANILKCRPDTPGETSGNRKPTPDEMKTCIPFLHSQIDLIRPRVLVALGGVAIEGLLGKSGITKLRGQWQTYRGIPLMPTFHPSYLLRTMSPRDKRHVWEDMLAVLEKLGLPVTEKQRGYFLPRNGQ